jgi:hypothetical protein
VAAYVALVWLFARTSGNHHRHPFVDRTEMKFAADHDREKTIATCPEIL